MLRNNSKLVARVNRDNYYVAIYHNCPVVYWDKINNEIVFENNGFNTISTAKAMSIALKDMGFENLRVSYSKKLDQLFLLHNNSNLKPTLALGEPYTHYHLENFLEFERIR